MATSSIPSLSSSSPSTTSSSMGTTTVSSKSSTSYTGVLKDIVTLHGTISDVDSGQITTAIKTIQGLKTYFQVRMAMLSFYDIVFTNYGKTTIDSASDIEKFKKAILYTCQDETLNELHSQLFQRKRTAAEQMCKEILEMTGVWQRYMQSTTQYPEDMMLCRFQAESAIDRVRVSLERTRNMPSQPSSSSSSTSEVTLEYPDNCKYIIELHDILVDLEGRLVEIGIAVNRIESLKKTFLVGPGVTSIHKVVFSMYGKQTIDSPADIENFKRAILHVCRLEALDQFKNAIGVQGREAAEVSFTGLLQRLGIFEGYKEAVLQNEDHSTQCPYRAMSAIQQLHETLTKELK